MECSSIVGALVLVAALIDVVAGSSGHHWAYTGEDDPAHWYNHYVMCSGGKQSPIDIDPTGATPQNFAPLYAANYDTRDKTMTAINNGHTVMITLPKNMSEVRLPYIKDGGLTNQFIFSQAHFHWGLDSSRGSEHTIRKKSYAAEIHFVHFNKKYGSMGNATSHPDGLAVLGVFVEKSDKENPAFKPLTNALDKMDAEVHEAPIDKDFSLRELLPNSMAKFYRYSGSLTTPACDEIVTWTVFDEAVSMSEKQLEMFRKQKTDDGDQLVNNYRPPQPLQGRNVYVRSGSAKMAASLALVLVPILSLLAA